MRDLEFQVDQLRRQLATHDAAITERGANSRHRIETVGAERRAIEERFATSTGALLEPLRGRPEHAELLRVLGEPSASS